MRRGRDVRRRRRRRGRAGCTGITSKTRCAKTVPTSVAHAPFRPGSLRVRTATRASSPMRPGSTAFANSPTENAEKTSIARGRGGSIAEWITVVQASARTTTESEVEADRDDDPLPPHIAECRADRREAPAPPPENSSDGSEKRTANTSRRRHPGRRSRASRFGGGAASWRSVLCSIAPLSSAAPMPLRSPHDREIVRLALPALGALAAEPLYVLADTAIVGHLGRPQIAALGLAGTVLAGAFTIFNFLTYGTTAVVARATGAGRQEDAARLAAQALWASLGIGFALLVGCEIVAVAAAPRARRSRPVGPLRARRTSGSPRSGFPRRSSRSRARAISAASRICAGRSRSSSSRTSRTSSSSCSSSTASTGESPGSAAGTAIAQAGMGVAFVVELLRPHAPSRRPSWREMRPMVRVGRQIFVRTAALYASFLVAASFLARDGRRRDRRAPDRVRALHLPRARPRRGRDRRAR